MKKFAKMLFKKMFETAFTSSMLNSKYKQGKDILNYLQRGPQTKLYQNI